MATTHQRTRRRGASLGTSVEEGGASRIIESIPHPAWIADANGGLEIVNQQFADHVGDSVERVLVHSWDRYLHPEDRASVMRAWYASVASGAPLQIDARLVRADLSYRRMRIRGAASRDDDGNVTHWACTATEIEDLVDRRVIIDKLRILTRADQAVAKSLDERTAVQEILAATVGEFAGVAWAELSTDGSDERRGVVYESIVLQSIRLDDLPTRARIAAELTAAASLLTGPTILPVPAALGGERIFGSLLMAPLSTARGRYGFVAFLSTTTPFTSDDLPFVEQLAGRLGPFVEHARLYAAVERERARLARIQEFTAALASATSLEDVASVIVTQGGAAFGAARAALYVLREADAALDAVQIEGYPAYLQETWRHVPLSLPVPLTAAVETRAPVFLGSATELRAQFRDTATLLEGWGEACAALPVLAGTRTLGAILLAFDAPTTFPRSRCGDLDGFARLCAQAIDRAMLFDMAQAERQRAEQANRSKDAFVGMVSHELRTPLNAILGWITLLRANRVPADRKESALETIHRNARTQSKLIEDLLDITRMAAGKLRLKMESVELATVATAALDAIRPAAEAKRIRIETLFDDSVSAIRGDPERIQQIAWNLLSNAVKFTPQGGRVALKIRRRGGDAIVEVEDSGKGIAPEFLPHVFERFRQAEEGSARGHGGLGLGLAIVRSLVELHGGAITAESDGAGYGARFIVRLPLESKPQPESTRALRVATPLPVDIRELLAPRLEGTRALVVDDEEDARLLLATLFSSWGMRVATASSAEEALRIVEKQRLDVIVSDIGMPGEDGYSFIERVRLLPVEAGGRTPAIALTAYARAEDRTRALLAGFNMHTTKPIDTQELREALELLVRGTDSKLPGRP